MELRQTDVLYYTCVFSATTSPKVQRPVERNQDMNTSVIIQAAAQKQDWISYHGELYFAQDPGFLKPGALIPSVSCKSNWKYILLTIIYELLCVCYLIFISLH